MDVVKSITNLFNDVFDTLKQRVSSPVIGTFFFSWLLFNWELVYYFLGSDEGVAHKINHIQLMYIDFTQNFCFPFTLTIAYLIFYPLVLNISNTVWVVVDSKSKSYFSKFTEKNAPISEEAQAKLFAHIRGREQEYKSVVRDKQRKINALNEALNVQTGELTRLKKKLGLDTTLSDESTTKSILQINNTIVGGESIIPERRSDNELERDISSVLNSVDGNYLLDDLIATKMELEKDDQIHKRELLASKEILLKLIGSYPEPWPVKEIKGVSSDGRSNISYSKDVVQSHGKKLIRKGWISTSEYGGVPSYSMTSELIGDLNNIVSRVK